MAGKIPQHFIDDLLARADIVETIDSRVKLRKTGKNYSACCPFHDEKTPSFTVSPDKQFYYCFGCGANGNAIGFLMEYDRLPFPEAVEKLAAGMGLEVPREQLAPGQEKRQRESQSLYQLTEKAADFYRQQLRNHPSAGRAVAYLRQRGLSGEIARDFGIGLAPPGWDNLLNALADTAEKADQLEQAGLAIRRQDSDGQTKPGRRHHYDRFRDRIMFPIRDQRGRPIAFGGRVLGDEKPKYLNSPETPIFHKSRELYGLWEARQANRDLKRLIVVEGYMDVVALAQFGIRCAVATLGTACGEEHIQLAFRHVPELVFCFDGDKAGRTAARRALEAALPQMQDGRSLRFLLLPEGEDPDTLVRQVGGERFEQLLDEQARPLEDFLFDLLGEGINLQTMDGRARLSKLAGPLLDQLPDGVYRQLMFQQLAARTGLDRATLEEVIGAEKARAAQARAQAQPQAANRPAAPATKPVEPEAFPATAEAPPVMEDIPPPDEMYDQIPDSAPAGFAAPQERPRSQYRLPAERMLIALLLHHPQLAQQIQDPGRFRNSAHPDLILFAELVELLQRRPDYNLNQLLGYWRAHHGADSCEVLAQLATSQLVTGARQLAQGDTQLEYDPQAEFRDCLQRLERAEQKARNRSLLEQLKSTGGQLSPEERALLANWQRKRE
ncbi:DNA primase [Microbulbifer flavimaris]|uniref:DNA primase n=1 Tax=Microbulbifer flavimaris TaxID=1781068 RepID=A0ABX4HZ34_9GAMM|nr:MULTISPECIES: DNA primase [Microbulbifer]KUJ82792.1 DNA primase [Microbulbifer sp. ZGT114]PCO04967.1 DNA primase [Microbulbifer flavimaris]